MSVALVGCERGSNCEGIIKILLNRCGTTRPLSFEGWGRGGIPQKPDSRATLQGLDQRSKMEEVGQRWRAGVTQMRNNPEGGELYTADDVRKLCKKNSPSVLSCISKRAREGCDQGSEVGAVHSG